MRYVLNVFFCDYFAIKIEFSQFRLYEYKEIEEKIKFMKDELSKKLVLLKS
jgi:hypothetical protein